MQEVKKVAVLGPRGTFSDSASYEYIKTLDEPVRQVYYSTIDEAMYSIGEECDFAIVPVENTLDGFVDRTLDILLEQDLHITAELSIPVQFSLVANADEIDDIKTLYCQFKANGQCRNTIDRLNGVSIITTESNVQSFDFVKRGRFGEAAIIARHMLEKSDCSFSIENATDSANNVTRFLIVEPGRYTVDVQEDSDVRVSFFVIPQKDEPGMLFNILRAFSENNINLVAIMSRPTRKDIGTYNFYMEIKAGYSEVETIRKTIADVKSRYGFRTLGFYSI